MSIGTWIFLGLVLLLLICAAVGFIEVLWHGKGSDGYQPRGDNAGQDAQARGSDTQQLPPQFKCPLLILDGASGDRVIGGVTKDAGAYYECIIFKPCAGEERWSDGDLCAVFLKMEEKRNV